MRPQITLFAAVLLLGAASFPTASIANDIVKPILLAQSPTPVTYMTVQSPEAISVQIREGEFFYHGILRRTYGSSFSATDGRVRVMYGFAILGVL